METYTERRVIRESEVESRKPLVYLACPYSHPDRSVRVARFQAVNKVAARLMGEGQFIFSPISHTHPIAEAGDLPLSWEYWATYDRAILSECHKLIVLKLEGWKESAGIKGEVQIATELGLQIEYLDGQILSTRTPRDDDFPEQKTETESK